MRETDPEVAALLALEQRRCAALRKGDVEELRSILSPAYRHVHANGRIDDLETYLPAAAANPRLVERGSLSVRLHGPVAELLGEQYNVFADRRSALVALQLAVRDGGEWRFATTQVTRKDGS
ncbi:nuclear transport factor 2 family protein [Sphingopyxis sp.]|uniref:nuclear transport factor 2 family protein n=1 Tax=Sphingopyxis sp. TaxID=1908224 RepID=UPI002B45F124|nr:nuclear transport factor 2 family protein [Sphingopyxis sp.]HJS09750.1 nuclear transport factor 2 family protein [Sphingopyxis sp.]